jgi:hypothetical protein
MAKVNSSIGELSGKIGALVFYRMRGSEKMIVRRKAALSKYALNYHSRYENTRQQNMEFKGCVLAAKKIGLAMYSIKPLGDFNSFGQVVKICKVIQQADSSNPKGKRSVYISKMHSLLDGFSFNKYNTFESLVRAPISISIDRPAGIAKAIIPPMRPGIHLVNPKEEPYYRFVCSLGNVSDVFVPDNRTTYETVNKNYSFCHEQVSPWTNWKNSFPGIEISVSLDRWEDIADQTLFAGIGIEFGRQAPGGEIEFVKYAGAGKIWVTA